MVVADTFIWIEWIAGTALGKTFGSTLGDTDQLLVPTLVQLELHKWCLRELTQEQGEIVIAATRAARVVPLTETIALYAAVLSRAHRLSTADAIVYATAQQFDARLVTIDRHFEGLDHVDYLAKTR